VSFEFESAWAWPDSHAKQFAAERPVGSNIGVGQWDFETVAGELWPRERVSLLQEREELHWWAEVVGRSE